MRDALCAWLDEAKSSRDCIQAATAAARAVSNDPWSVVQHAGRLARCSMATASEDTGLTATLTRVTPGHRASIATVHEGDPYPAIDRSGTKLRGAFDTPAAMARETVRIAIESSQRPIRTAIDPACGTGAFLVALNEQSDCQITGIELDPIAAAVAAVAVPNATVVCADGFSHEAKCDLIVGNPPFVPPERQDKTLRTHLRTVMPWLTGRFDLAVPFAAHSIERVHSGGGVGLILPESIMHQPYAKPLRTQWLTDHTIAHLSHASPFPGAQVGVVVLGMTVGTGPAPLPSGIEPKSILELPAAPLHPSLKPGDAALVRHIRQISSPLGQFATIDTGVVSHGAHGGKGVLIHDDPTPERVPYVDARDLIENRTKWLDYRPETMHRPKDPALFEAPKVLVQRLRGRGAIRAWADRSGLFAGHTLTVVRPDTPDLSIEAIQRLITHPMIDGLLRMERGSRLDLYPRDVRSVPVPNAWLTNPNASVEQAFELSSREAERLIEFSLE